MAERRMFTQKIVDSDAFLDMPLSAQALYFHLNMRADDDGFVNNPRKIQRMIGASDDDLKLLMAKRFILAFDSGVIVIKHWRMHNILRKDRYKPTQYQDEVRTLIIKDNGAYTEGGDRPSIVQKEPGNQMATSWQPVGNQMAPQDSIGKVSIGKVSIGKDSLYVVQGSTRGEGKTAENIPSLVLIDGSEWRPQTKDLEEWRRIYNRVDIGYEFDRMRQWCLNNPAKAKTAYEIRGFVTRWLDQEQRKTGGRQAARGADAYFEMAQEAINGFN